MFFEWELQKIRTWTTEEIRNRIWANVSHGQPIPGCISIDALRAELIRRNEDPVGFHNA